MVPPWDPVTSSLRMQSHIEQRMCHSLCRGRERAPEPALFTHPRFYHSAGYGRSNPIFPATDLASFEFIFDLDQRNVMSLSCIQSLQLIPGSCSYGYNLIDARQWKLRSNERRYGRGRRQAKGRAATVDEAITKFPRGGRPTDRNGIAAGASVRGVRVPSALPAISDGGSWVKSGGLIFFPVVSPILVDDGTVRNVKGEKLTGGRVHSDLRRRRNVVFIRLTNR